MNKLMKMLDNCGESIKKIAGFCFLFFIVIAVAYFAFGLLNVLSAISSLLEYYDTISEIFNEMSDFSILQLVFGTSEEFKNLFIGILLCISSVFSIFTSILSLPLYGFGCIVEDVKRIKENTEKNISYKG
ncbi:MAG: hypothetical protein IKB08_00745 [Clostridia bacterium]|nr:hypothetical protein [Clostridia bacterium]